MSKKLLVVIGILVVLLAGGITGYMLLGTRQEKVGMAPNIPVSIPESGTNNASYQDSSGFSFGYPKGLTVSDVTPDNYYSLLNVSKEGQAIKITVKDGKAFDIAFSGSDLIGATTLGGISAKQYKNGNNLVTAAQDAGVVYLIEGPKDGGFWENAQNTIVSTFMLGESSQQGGGSDITEEEMVQ